MNSGEHTAAGNEASLTALQTASFSRGQQSLLLTISLAGHCDVWIPRPAVLSGRAYHVVCGAPAPGVRLNPSSPMQSYNAR